MLFSEFISVVFIGLLLLLEVSARQNEEHNYGSPRRRPSTLIQSPRRNLLGPTYETVPNNPSPGSRKRIRKINFRRIKLWLDPNHGVLFTLDTPVFSVRSTGRSLQPEIQEYPNVFRHIISNLYDDIFNASIPEMIQRNSYDLSMRGFRRPLPRRFLRPRVYVPKPVIFNRNGLMNIVSITNNSFDRSFSISQKPKPAIPSIIHPEILVIVDYALYKKFHRSVWELVPYLVGFWNGVDFRYRDFNQPHVRLNIAGILIAEDKKALSYIEQNLREDSTLDNVAAIVDKQKWLYEQRAKIPVTSYDIALTMTGIKFNAKGFATRGGACLIDHAFQKSFQTGFVNDLGGYEAIMAAAHEIGHLLGMNHDESSKFGGKCGERDGFIMAPVLLTKGTSWSWSLCSQSDFQNFLNNGNGTCLYNKPKSHGVLPRLLPGKVIDGNEQCKRLGFLRVVTSRKICQKMQCVLSDNPSIHHISSDGAADGTACGIGRICLRGVCKLESSVK